MQIRRMNTRRAGFTLVELLTVIVIIGILAGLATAAAIAATNAARRARINAEINALALALEAYKNEHGEYPPDFSDPAAVDRHLKKRFPRYTGDAAAMRTSLDANYGINAFSPASALVFWLGGLPMDSNPSGNYDPKTNPYKPQGFHTDETNPFQPNGPRTAPAFDFKLDRVKVQGGELSYRAPTRAGMPYVYFRSKVLDASGRRGYDPSDLGRQRVTIGSQIAVPYARDANNWYEEDKFQIISAGLDDDFGSAEVDQPRIVPTAAGFTDGDFDNQANFCDKATLEGMQ